MSFQEMCDLREMNERLRHLDEASRVGDTNKLKQLIEEDPSLLDGFDHFVPERARDNPLHIAASHGHVDFTIELLRLKPELKEMRNREGRLPLHLAAAKGHLQVVQKLVDQQDSRKFCLLPESKYGYMPAHIAAINGHNTVVEMLVERCNDVLEKTTHKSQTLLHLVIRANCLDSVRYLINQEVSLNGQDVDGNTGLHLACQKRNHQVISYLLDQENIEVNPINAFGLTPFDVLLLTSWDFTTEVSLVELLRRAGGQGAREFGNPQSNFANLRRNFSYQHNHRGKKLSSDAQTLLVVATLVATMTFPAILNPPGGFIQLPFEKSDDLYQHDQNYFQDPSKNTIYKNWIYTASFPSGRPVLLWQLLSFFILDSMALFSSISVILILLCGIPKSNIMMKFMVFVLWLAVFCTGLAFASAFLVFYVPYSISEIRKKIPYPNFSRIWVLSLTIAWAVIFGTAALWASFQVIRFLWRKGGFKGKLPNWINRIRWPKNGCFRKTTSIIFMVSFSITHIAAYGLLFSSMIYTAKQ